MAQEKKIPQRRCTACGERRDKKDLIRIVRTPEGSIEADPTGKQNGRGAYLCRSEACLKKAEKTKSLERSLKTPIPKEVYERLREEFTKD